VISTTPNGGLAVYDDWTHAALYSGWLSTEWFQLALTAPVQFLVDTRFYISWKALKRHTATMPADCAGTSAAYFSRIAAPQHQQGLMPEVYYGNSSDRHYLNSAGAAV